MADAFYTLQEAAAKLNKTAEEVQEMVKQGKLREYRGDTGEEEGAVYKAADVEALMAKASAAPEETEELISDDEISLAPEPDEGLAEESKSTGGDTTAMTGEGINVLGDEEGEDYKLADDTLSETKLVSDGGGALDDTLGATRGASSASEASLEEIEEDVNLDTFGSGSGLLDLSLQADDTSLGGILDEIYTPESEGEEGKAPEASALEVAAEADQLMPEEGPAAAEPGPEAPIMVQGYAEPAPDMISNAFGIMLVLPFLAVIYTVIVTTAAFKNTIPAVRTAIQDLIWYITIGAAVASGLVVGIAFMLGGKGGKTTVKKKEKKEKKAKKEKKKKGKKKKTKETEEAPEAEQEPDIENI
jgi:hypothetical protein